MSYDLSRTLFSIGDRKFSCGEFLEALKFYGIYGGWCERILRGGALEKKAADLQKEIDLAALAEMTSEFRYSQKLLTSEEFGGWLDSIGLEMGDYESYLKRTYWQEELEDLEVEVTESEVDDRKFFSEVYFSGSFKGLLSSWQQRLLAWRDCKEEDFPAIAELEGNFKEYKKTVLKYFDKEMWLTCHRNDFAAVEIEYLSGKKTDLKSLRGTHKSFKECSFSGDLELRGVQSFYRDLPDEFQENLETVTPGETFGPFEFNEEYVLGRLISKQLPGINDEEIIEELEGEFCLEVWKTLQVKYVS